MIHTIAIATDGRVLSNLSVHEIFQPHIAWAWVDLNQPTEEESNLLHSAFHFHPLAIEDCLHGIQRPKMDTYEEKDRTYHFFILHHLNEGTLKPEEVNVFFDQHVVVSYHHQPVDAFRHLWNNVQRKHTEAKPVHVLHEILDTLVDAYFPIVYAIESELDHIEENGQQMASSSVLKTVYDCRSDLLRLRRTILPMKELLYRMLNSTKLTDVQDHQPYFQDIHDHLLKLNEMIESSREFTSDIRDSYYAVTSHKMNAAMMTLTVMSAIFMPLTFIAGVYGMNFAHMPELQSKYGYFITLGSMVIVACGMVVWFYKKGWFRKI